MTSYNRYTEWSQQGAYLCSGIEYSCGKSAVFFRKVFGYHFDGAWKVAAFTDSQYTAGCQKQPYANCYNGPKGVGGNGQGTQTLSGSFK